MFYKIVEVLGGKDFGEVPILIDAIKEVICGEFACLRVSLVREVFKKVERINYKLVLNVILKFRDGNELNLETKINKEGEKRKTGRDLISASFP